MNVERFRGSEFLVKEVRSRLFDILQIYDCVTVADYYDIVGYGSTYTDSKYGWTSLRNVVLVMTDEPDIYELVLPKAMPID